MLTAVNEFRNAAWRRSLAPVVDDPAELEQSTEEMADAHVALHKAMAVVTLDVPEGVLASVQRLGDYADTFFHSCQSQDGDDDDEAIWWVPGENGDEQVSADTVVELFDGAHQAFVSAVRQYLNADASSTA